MVKCFLGVVLLWFGSRIIKLGFKMSGDGGYVDIKMEKRFLIEELEVLCSFGLIVVVIFFTALFVF